MARTNSALSAPPIITGRLRSAARGAARYAFIVLCVLLFFLPIWWMVVSALRPEDEIFKYVSDIGWRTIFPTELSFDSIRELWQGGFRRSILNSIYITAITVVIGLVLSASAAFVLVVVTFPFRNLVFVIMVVSFLIPFDAIAVPLYSVFTGLKPNLNSSI